MIDDSETATFVVLSPIAGPFGLTGKTLHGTGTFSGSGSSFSTRWNMLIEGTADPSVFAETGTWTPTGAVLEGEGRFRGTCTLRGIEDLRWVGAAHEGRVPSTQPLRQATGLQSETRTGGRRWT